MKERAMMNHQARGTPGHDGPATFRILQRMEAAGAWNGGTITGGAIRAWGRRDIERRQAKRETAERRITAMDRRITAMDRRNTAAIAAPPPPPPTPAERWEANLRRRGRLEQSRLVIVRQNNSDARRRGYFLEPTTQCPHRRLAR